MSGGQLSVIGYGFPLRQCQLPATWKQVSDKSCKAFSRGLVLGYSKEWGFLKAKMFGQLKCKAFLAQCTLLVWLEGLVLIYLFWWCGSDLLHPVCVFLFYPAGCRIFLLVTAVVSGFFCITTQASSLTIPLDLSDPIDGASSSGPSTFTTLSSLTVTAFDPL